MLTGARQVGKTTLLRERFPEYGFVSLDLPSLAEQAENEPQVFLNAHSSPLIIDVVRQLSGTIGMHRDERLIFSAATEAQLTSLSANGRNHPTTAG